MNEILTLNNVCKSYTKFRLNNVSFSVPKGCIMGFIGENGAGKTTTIKLILNQITREKGTISVFGMDNRTKERSIKEQIGVVFDEGFFHQGFVAKDICRVMRSIYQSWEEELFARYLKEFDLPEHQVIKEYSKGMKMKLSIATALAHRPKLLILDEATSGLDPIVRNEILDIFQDFIQDEEHSILFSSHITGDLERIADYITFIHQGEIVFSRSKDDLMMKYGVLKCSSADFSRMDPSDIVGIRRNEFGYEVLVSDKQRCRRKYPGAIIDNASMDDIMLFTIKGHAKASVN